MRLAIAGSGTRNAAAISPVVRPPTARRVRAICDAKGSAEWQHRNSRVNVSSWTGAASAVHRRLARARQVPIRDVGGAIAAPAVDQPSGGYGQ